ncbi:MAG: tetratricopeptide repeat protein [bacterium]
MPELTPDQAILFQKGKEMGEQGHHAYAVELLGHLVKEVPELIEARRLLRASEIAEQKAKPSWIRRLQTIVLWMKARLVLGQSPFKKMEIAEEILAVTPLHRHGNALLAEAAASAGLHEVCILAHETLCRAFPGNISHFKNLGKVCLSTGRLAAAQAAYEKALRLNPHDGETIKGLKDACALQATSSGGWDKNIG